MLNLNMYKIIGGILSHVKYTLRRSDQSILYTFIYYRIFYR